MIAENPRSCSTNAMHSPFGDHRPPLAVVLFGLATAPMYPLLILTTAERTSSRVADRVVGLQAAASSLGGEVLPPLVGQGPFQSQKTLIPP